MEVSTDLPLTAAVADDPPSAGYTITRDQGRRFSRINPPL